MTANRLLNQLATHRAWLVVAAAVAVAEPAIALLPPPSPIEMSYYGSTSRIRGFDPVTSADVPSAKAIYKVYEGLYEYEYLVRPYTVRPNLAKGMPEVSPDGLTYTFHLKKGVRFTDDPCFPDGKGREVTAADFVYSWKRSE